jgi:hypothetical protein
MSEELYGARVSFIPVSSEELPETLCTPTRKTVREALSTMASNEGSLTNLVVVEGGKLEEKPFGVIGGQLVLFVEGSFLKQDVDPAKVNQIKFAFVE